jgi:hypothetical protein
MPCNSLTHVMCAERALWMVIIILFPETSVMNGRNEGEFRLLHATACVACSVVIFVHNF